MKSGNPFTTPLSLLKGIGPKRKALLLACHIETLGDLLHVLPKTYQKWEVAENIAAVAVGEITIIRAYVLSVHSLGFGTKKRLEIHVGDKSGHLTLVFFAGASFHLLKWIRPKQMVTVVGTAEVFLGRLQMAHPQLYPGDQSQSLIGIKPIYPQLQQITSQEFARFIDAALAYWGHTPLSEPTYALSLFPEHLRAFTLFEAYRVVHHPPQGLAQTPQREKELLAVAQQRIAFEFIVRLQLILAQRRFMAFTQSTCQLIKEQMNAIRLDFLPFLLTRAQRRALDEIGNDMAI